MTKTKASKSPDNGTAALDAIGPAEPAEKAAPAEKDSSFGEQPHGDPRNEAYQRAARCGEALTEVLERYRCDVRALINPVKQVGQDGDEIQVSCTWGVIPRL